MTGKEDTKATITERVVTADKIRIVRFGDKDYEIRKMKWKVAIPLYKKVRELLVKIIPGMVDNSSTGELDWSEILTSTPIEILVEIVNASTDLDISLDPTHVSDDEPELELVLCLAGESFKFNFVDSEGVQRFFDVVRRGIGEVKLVESQTPGMNLPSSKSRDSFAKMDSTEKNEKI